jgi:hypothetical protein
VKQILERLRGQIAAVYNLAGVAPERCLPPRVTVVLGSSRSGSSLLFHLLSESGAFVSPQGEETPFYRLAGQGWVTTKSQSDVIRIPVDEPIRARALDLLSADIGGDVKSEIQDPAYLAQCATRLLWQWSHLDLGPDRVWETFSKWARTSADATSLWMNVLEALDLETGFYDLPGPKSRNLHFEAPDFFLEEPPFVIQHPRDRPEGSLPLLLKTSTNAYRIAWLKTLFPGVEFRFVILARNPAACINGLMDGWLSNAFHSHNLQFVAPLKIRGYTDVVPFGDRWWKFDLPPGWNDFDDAPLADVCAFQWRAAYSAILQQSEGALMVKCEDLMNPALTASVLERICEFSGATPLRQPQLSQIRPIMASQTPGPARWRTREDEIWPLLQESRVREIAERLGYDLSSPERLL